MSRPSVERVAPALAHEANPLIAAVADGSQPGTVWAGDGAAVVATRFGFMQWLGSTADAALFRRLADAIVAEGGELPGYLLWYEPPQAWLAWLRQRGARERERLRWRFAGTPGGAAPALPAGLSQQPLDASNARSAGGLGLDLDRFWPSIDALLAHGVGTCIVDDATGEVLACAYSACVAAGQAEADIAVAPSARGRGLGHVVGRAFVEACLARGILPAWDCFTANEASMRLAPHLGFSPSHRYPLLSFNRPLPAHPASRTTR